MRNVHTNYDVCVIGGGPAGLMAAGRAAELGAKVLIIEKNEQLGKKLSITGGGRCNITHAEFETDAFLKNFGDASKFLHSPFSKFSVQDTFDFFESHNLPLVVESRKRAFPKTQRAEDVLDVFTKYAKKNGVVVEKGMSVKNFVVKNGKVVGVETSAGKRSGIKFILATGGLSAPSTGSTGDGFKMLQALGHTIHKPSPNLVPLKTSAAWVHRLSGVSLSFVTVRFKQNGKTHLKKIGKILFTHFGISGPLIINSSYVVSQMLKYGNVTASINCFPDTDFADLEKRVLKLFEQNKNKQIKNVLPELLPKKLSDAVLYIVGTHFGNTKTHSVTKEERKKIVHILQDLAFPITATMGLDRAIVADGGVSLEEVDFKDMSSRIYNNIYIVGDVLHINRPSGGFSLQLCWTTGHVAGTAAAT